MLKTVDLSTLFAEYRKAKIAFTEAETAFDGASPPDVDKAYDRFERAGDDLFDIACQIVDSIMEAN